MLLEFHRSARDPWVVLAIFGELDMPGERLSQVGLGAVVGEVAGGNNRLVLDLSAVDFIDSVGLGTVVGALRRVRAHDGDLILVCSEPRILRVFEMCDLDRVFEIHADVDSAVEATGRV